MFSREYDAQVTEHTLLLRSCFTEGQIPPASKLGDIIPKLAVALHTITHAYDHMMSDQGDEELTLPMEISKETYDNALTLYQRIEEQKNVFLSVSLHFIIYIYQLSCYF